MKEHFSNYSFFLQGNVNVGCGFLKWIGHSIGQRPNQDLGGVLQRLEELEEDVAVLQKNVEKKDEEIAKIFLAMRYLKCWLYICVTVGLYLYLKQVE